MGISCTYIYIYIFVYALGTLGKTKKKTRTAKEQKRVVLLEMAYHAAHNIFLH